MKQPRHYCLVLGFESQNSSLNLPLDAATLFQFQKFQMLVKASQFCVKLPKFTFKFCLLELKCNQFSQNLSQNIETKIIKIVHSAMSTKYVTMTLTGKLPLLITTMPSKPETADKEPKLVVKIHCKYFKTERKVID